MANNNLTKNDQTILMAAKKYIQTTESTTEQFVSELMNLAGQSLEHYGENLIEENQKESILKA